MEKTGKKQYIEDLVILDYASGAVHFYKIDPEVNINNDYISKLGFNIDECYYMFGENIDVVKHMGILL